MSDYPFLCLAYKLPHGQSMTLAVRISGIGWRSIAMASAGTNAFPLVGTFWDYSDNDLIDDDKYVTNASFIIILLL